MNARDAIASAIHGNEWQNRWELTSTIIAQLATAGFTIMSKEDAEAVRNELLDRASEAALAVLINDTDSNPRLAAKVENAIRSLKTGEKEQ